MKIKDIEEIEEVNEEATSPYLKPKEPSQEEQYSNLINEYKERLNKEDEEISWQERLPDILSAAHNTINYARGNPQANIKTSSVADAMKKRSKSRKKDLSGLEKLQQLHQNYMGTQRTKDRDEKMDKRYKNEKSFQEDKYYDSLMRQEDQDQMTSDKFNYMKQRNLDMDKLKASEYGDKKSMLDMNLKLLQNKLDNQGVLTPYQQEVLTIQKKHLENSELNRELRKENKDLTESRLNEKENQRQNEYVSNKIIDLRKTLNKDERFKQMTKEGMAFDQVDNLMSLAEKGNQVAFGALGTKMARAMGEVGVLTDSDVVRYIQGGSLSRSAGDTLSKWMTGKPGEASIEDIKSISTVLKQIHSTKLAPIFDEYAKTAYENLPMSRREAYKRLSIPIPPNLIKSQKFFDKNKKMLKEKGITTEKQAEQYLIELGKL